MGALHDYYNGLTVELVTMGCPRQALHDGHNGKGGGTL